MSEVDGRRLNDAEPWSQWQEPIARPGPPLHRDPAFELENLRAGIAQASALLPLAGPGIAFAANRRGSFARREAAKAFNGQMAALFGSAALVGPAVVGYFIATPSRGNLSFADFPPAFFGVFAIWAVQAIIGTLTALKGRDWTSPMNRMFRVRILPEGIPDPARAGTPTSSEISRAPRQLSGEVR